ncbi:MAG: cytochrome c [Boseongicola sp.]|nr:cytochrome c [Boseongicola sp.]MDE0695365.1 cytochrome c [Boseongicola sp.]
MKRRCIAAGVILAAATTALAHQGVQSPAVKARMHGMSAIAENLKTLGMMARGATAFDVDAARAAAAAIATHASTVPELFEANETDPMSKARPAIWTNFEDFRAKASVLESIADGLSTSITTPEDLGPAMGSLGASCNSCHSIYRE